MVVMDNLLPDSTSSAVDCTSLVARWHEWGCVASLLHTVGVI